MCPALSVALDFSCPAFVWPLPTPHFSDASQFPGRDDCDLELNSRFKSWFETPVQSKLSIRGISSL